MVLEKARNDNRIKFIFCVTAGVTSADFHDKLVNFLAVLQRPAAGHISTPF